MGLMTLHGTRQIILIEKNYYQSYYCKQFVNKNLENSFKLLHSILLNITYFVHMFYLPNLYAYLQSNL